MNRLRTIETTGEKLVDDVKRLYCLTCEGLGYTLPRDPQDENRECPDCQGFGY